MSPKRNVTGSSSAGVLQRLAHEEGYCVIVVTHDLAIADMADEVLRLKDGALVD